MRHSIAILTLIVMCLLSAQPGRSEGFTITPPGPACTNRVQRVEFAKGLLRYFKSVDSAIPNLKPAQLDWIKNEQSRLEELRKHNGVKWSMELAKFQKSKEYLINAIKPGLARIEGYLSNIINLKDSPTFPELQEAEEMVKWAILEQALLLYDTDENLRDLRGTMYDLKEEIIDSSINIPALGTLTGECANVVAAIGHYIILPHLMAQERAKLSEQQNKQPK
jgi:hypothetical protein